MKCPWKNYVIINFNVIYHFKVSYNTLRIFEMSLKNMSKMYLKEQLFLILRVASWYFQRKVYRSLIIKSGRELYLDYSFAIIIWCDVCGGILRELPHTIPFGIRSYAIRTQIQTHTISLLTFFKIIFELLTLLPCCLIV